MANSVEKTKSIKKMVRAVCGNFQPYVAGRPIEAIKRELKLKKVYKLASNENPLGPSKKAIKAVKKAASNMFFYPDSNSWELKQEIAKHFHVKPDNIMLGSGSDEIIEIIAKVFFNTDDEIVVSDHAFIRYKMAGDLMGARVISVPMKNYTHDLDEMFKHVHVNTKAIFIANPNNPTGTYNARKSLEEFLDHINCLPNENKPLVVIDEAYYEYASHFKDYPQTLRYLKRYPNLIILRTFSKIYGLAGLRVGYGFASEEIVSYYERVRPPFNVNLPAQVAAVASLNDKLQVKRSNQLVITEMKYFYSELGKLNIPYIPSAANFILINVKPFKGSEVFKNLLKKGIIVRAMDEYGLPYHIRVTIGLPQENKLFIKELSAVCSQLSANKRL